MKGTDVSANRLNASRLGVLIFVCFTAYLLGGGSRVAFAQEGVPQSGPYPTAVDPWEVILYEHPDYTGMWISYRMAPGMRHRLVPLIPPAMEDKASSIQVGSKVAVTIFRGRNFMHTDEWTLEGQKVSRQFIEDQWTIRDSQSDLDGFSDSLSSLVVFPKAVRDANGYIGPLGVWLWDERSVPGSPFDALGQHYTFFPLPQSEKDTEAAYPFLGHVDLDKNANRIAIWRSDLEVTLYAERDFMGAQLPLPGAGQKVDSFFENFSKYGWSDRAASLKVRWKGSPLNLGPPVFYGISGMDLPGGDYRSFFGGMEECERVCREDHPKCQAFTWVKASIQGAKATCWLKSSVPDAAVKNDKCVSGYTGSKLPQLPGQDNPVINAPLSFTTESGVNYPSGDYKSFYVDGGPEECEKACVGEDRKCLSYTWVKPDVLGPKAVCLLKSSVPASSVNDGNCVSGYSGTKPPQPQTQQQMERTGTGSFSVPPKPQPQPEPQPSATPDISGLWHSSLAIDYTIKQTGEQFTWTLVLINETGQGTLTGQSLTVSWSGPFTKGSATGKVTQVDAQGKATRIEWDNGAVFSRQ